MLVKKWCIWSILLIGAMHVRSQSEPSIINKFTWEGAFEGNKAIWKADDTLNVYKDVQGIDVTVRLLDPLKLNTTTSNPSEFNDWTKTNTFFRRGSLAFQIVSRGKKQAACLEFVFSRPVMMTKFPVWDIDMLQSTDNPWSTYQDSLSFSAENDTGRVSLNIEPMTKTSKVFIKGHEVRAICIPGVNGDLLYNDPDGGIIVSSTSYLNKFTLCYANGSDDDGLSNSHATRMPEFQFAELLGSVSGFVREDITENPLAGAVLRLLDADGNQVYNRQGQLMEATTGADGSYSFGYLPLGVYTVVQTDPKGYESVRDTDGANDNRIEVKLTFLDFVTENNDFFEKLLAPLPVSITGLRALPLSDGWYRLEWKTESEYNNDRYIIALSGDGIRFTDIGSVKSANTPGNEYGFDFKGLAGNVFYVRLSQADFDGRNSVLGTLAIRQESKELSFSLYPNPAKSFVTLSLPDADGAQVTIHDICGRLVLDWQVPQDRLEETADISGLQPGMYTVKCQSRRDMMTKLLMVR